MTNPLHTVRRGSGRPIVLVHGLGSSWATWLPVLDPLAARREVIAIDLPGFGDSAPFDGPVTIATLTDALSRFLRDENLDRADVVGSSMGARIALELARRGHAGSVVALSPGGFWSQAERTVFGATVGASVAVIRSLQGVAPALSRSRSGRTALLSQFSDRPWDLDPGVVLTELRSIAKATRLDEALDALAHAPNQSGRVTTHGRVAIGWGRQDRVTLPRQATVALAAFPTARFHGFHRCGHYPHWDQPAEAARFILQSTQEVRA